MSSLPRLISVFILLLFSHIGLLAQNNLLQSGPMLGYVDMREVLLWAQTTEAAEVSFEYWEVGNEDVKWKTDVTRTSKKHGYTAKCIADQVEPGRSYEYKLMINGKVVERPYPTKFKTQTLWQYRTDPPAFSIAVGSCSYINEEKYDRPGKGYGGTYDIFSAIYKQEPDIMLWLGDNTYYREPDWSTRTGMYHRFTHTRSIPVVQPLLASTNHYAVWDDHDFGPNDSDGTWIHKETAWEVFRDFWGNPTFGIPGQKGVTSYFNYNDVDVFMLDNRYFRTPNKCESCPRTILGKEQLEWIKGALAQSRAPFKLVAIGGQVLTTNKAHETYINLAPGERQELLDHIEREDIRGVIFLSGDRHFTELSMLENKAGNIVYDMTTSPLTAGAYKDPKEKNEHRVEDTLLGERNFSVLRVSGPRKERLLEITVYDSFGNEKWKQVIEAPK